MDLATPGNDALVPERLAAVEAEEQNAAAEKLANGKAKTRARKRAEPPIMPTKHWPTSSV
jgi:hypothetical protein